MFLLWVLVGSFWNLIKRICGFWLIRMIIPIFVILWLVIPIINAVWDGKWKLAWSVPHGVILTIQEICFTAFDFSSSYTQEKNCWLVAFLLWKVPWENIFSKQTLFFFFSLHTTCLCSISFSGTCCKAVCQYCALVTKCHMVSPEKLAKHISCVSHSSVFHSWL